MKQLTKNNNYLELIMTYVNATCYDININNKVLQEELFYIILNSKFFFKDIFLNWKFTQFLFN